ncbi:MAG TPA: hypothetical protein VLJ57_24005 [Burkholderiaceae bacterium]|nr:hypothetical protein [Burkholderiaceae bacterium]
MRKLKASAGNAMVEVLLATAIIVPLGMYAIQKQKADLEEAKGVVNSERTMDFTELAKSYYLQNADAIRAAMLDGTGADKLCRLGINPGAAIPEETGIQSNSTVLHTCAVDASVLRWKGFAPQTFPDYNLQQQRMVAIFKRVYDTAVMPAVPTDNVEMLSVGAAGATGLASYAPNSRGFTGGIDPIMRDAKSMGAAGGIIPDADRVLCKWLDADPTQREACGTQGGWRVKLSDFVGS